MHDQQWQACCASAPAQRQEGSTSELPLESVEGCYLAALHSSLLGELRLEPLVVGLSDGYELCRWVLCLHQGGGLQCEEWASSSTAFKPPAWWQRDLVGSRLGRRSWKQTRSSSNFLSAACAG